jgi:hypothetical protein
MKTTFPTTATNHRYHHHYHHHHHHHHRSPPLTTTHYHSPPQVLFSRPESVKPAVGIKRRLTITLGAQELGEDPKSAIGMEFSRRVGQEEHIFGVMGVLPDGPADRAGVHEGDVLLEVGGSTLTRTKLTPAMTRDDVERLLLAAGSEIEVLVVHSDDDARVENDDVRVITLRRDKCVPCLSSLDHRLESLLVEVESLCASKAQDCTFYCSTTGLWCSTSSNSCESYKDVQLACDLSLYLFHVQVQSIWAQAVAQRAQRHAIIPSRHWGVPWWPCCAIWPRY